MGEQGEEGEEEEEESQEMRQDDLMRPGERRRRTIASDQQTVQHRMRLTGSLDSKKVMFWQILRQKLSVQPMDLERIMQDPSETTTIDSPGINVVSPIECCWWTPASSSSSRGRD